MHPEGIPLHVGINYMVFPTPEINKPKLIDFQNALVNAGINFNKSEDLEREIQVIGKTPPLVIRVIANDDAPVGQLLILASHPNRTPDDVAREAEAIVDAFGTTWKSPKQILSCDCAIRYLYETSEDHAFKELWRIRLQQPEDSLDLLGRPVLGGGIRFVMPPIQDEEDPVQIEVKIESYLQDTKKIFVEAHFKWQPKPSGLSFSATSRIKTVDKYIENEVRRFITGETS